MPSGGKGLVREAGERGGRDGGQIRKLHRRVEREAERFWGIEFSTSRDVRGFIKKVERRHNKFR